jgi:hypothetical protein
LNRLDQGTPYNEGEDPAILPFVSLGQVNEQLIKEGKVVFKWPEGMSIGQSRVSKRQAGKDRVNNDSYDNWQVLTWFPCLEVGCGKKFKTHADLKRHQRMASSHKNYKPPVKRKKSRPKANRQELYKEKLPARWQRLTHFQQSKKVRRSEERRQDEFDSIPHNKTRPIRVRSHS